MAVADADLSAEASASAGDEAGVAVVHRPVGDGPTTATREICVVILR
jgi:hypothetical protein